MNNNDGSEIPAVVSADITTIIGPYRVIENYRVQGARTMVWKVTNGSKSFILKLYRKKRKWHPEVYAYSNWVTEYAPYAPELITVIEHEDIQGILTSEISGVPLRQLQMPDPVKAEVFFRAGQLAGNLHRCQPGKWFGIPDSQGFPLQDCFNDPVTAMKTDFQRWFTKAIDLHCLEKTEIAIGEWALDQMGVFAGERPLPINQDYTPGNWLIDEQGNLVGVIDFECMLWGVRVNSFGLLWHRYFPQNPQLENAFWEGYGVNPWNTDPIQVGIVCIQIGMADIALGTEYNNEQNILSGRQMIRRMAKALSI